MVLEADSEAVTAEASVAELVASEVVTAVASVVVTEVASVAATEEASAVHLAVDSEAAVASEKQKRHN